MWATPRIGGRAGPPGAWAIRTVAAATSAVMRRYPENMKSLYTPSPALACYLLIYVSMKTLPLLLLLAAASHLCAQAPGAPPAAAPSVPDWALPGSATHTQVPPPMDFQDRKRALLYGMV